MLNSKTGKAFTFKGGSPQNAERLTTWDNNVRAAALSMVDASKWDFAPPFVDVPLRVSIDFRLTRPSGHWGKGNRAGQLAPKAPMHPRGKPDIDKLARSTLDSMTGIVFDDDSRIVWLNVTKMYASPGREGARILVEHMPNPEDWIP
jgi:crossover junction endodeoxyribonuclease RusA